MAPYRSNKDDPRPRVSIGKAEPLQERLRSALGDDVALVTGAPFDCQLRLLGPAEGGKDQPRLLRRHRLRASHVPILVVLPPEAPGNLVRDCFREGAQDVITEDELETTLARSARRALASAASGRSHEAEAQRMTTELGERARRLEATLEALKDAYDQTLAALVTALDHRERETACHSQRVAIYSVLLGQRVGLDEDDLENLFRGALLHDIGKIGIPDAVLLNPGSFSEEEWEIMRSHTRIGAEILGNIAFLETASEVPLAHHEAWSGGGYPAGLAGEAIPLHARIFAVVDSYDAIRSRRPYKPAQSHDEAMQLLRRAASERLDPQLVELFLDEPESTWQMLEKGLRDELTFEDAMRVCQEVPQP